MLKNLIFFILFTGCLTAATAQDLPRSVKHADEISQDEIVKYQEQMKINNLSMSQFETLLSEKGMSKAEIDKIKKGIENLQNGVNTEQVTTPPREAPEKDYKTFTKPPASGGVFGSSFFTTPSLSFEPNLRIATPASYVLGPDDELLINISGYQEANLKVQVQPEGTIRIPQVGVMNVLGLTIDEATAKIKSKMIQTAYPNLKNGSTKLNITLGKIRSINVTIIGAAKPGNYTVSSLTTLFNSLFLCGGPDNINTYREIELIRNNKVFKKVDLYQFLTRGDLSGNVLLKENDVINFPVYKKRVTILGEVKRPGIFEMLEGETMDKLLFFAGGFTDKAFTASLKIKQVNESEKKIKDISKAEYANYQLANGDQIRVDVLPDRLENGVTITGAVYRTGPFELTQGLTIGGLIKKAGGLKEDAFMQRAMLNRISDDKTKESISFQLKDVLSGINDVSLQKGDAISIASVTDFRSEYTVRIEGEVRKPGDYPYRNNLSLKDLLFLSGSFTDASSPYNIEISRRLTKDGLGYVTDSIAKVFTVNTERELASNENAFSLKPFDIITVRRSPAYKEQKRVTITGEVVYPGLYTITSKNDRISDLLKRAGGLSPSAYLEGLSLIRNANIDKIPDSIRQQRIKQLQRSIKDTSNKVLEDNKNLNLKIAINTEQVLKNPGSKDDYVLEEGDMIEVAKLDPLVKISGEVLLASKTNFEEGRSLKYYIRRAGGLTENAKLSKSYVVYANGEIDKTNKILFGIFRSYPKIKTGSEIVIPGKSEGRHASFAETLGITSTLVSIFSVIVLTIITLKR